MLGSRTIPETVKDQNTFLGDPAIERGGSKRENCGSVDGVWATINTLGTRRPTPASHHLRSATRATDAVLTTMIIN